MGDCILVIEDQEDNRRVIRDLLTVTAYEVVEAEDGAEGPRGGREATAGLDSDGYSTAGHERLRGHAQNQG